MPTSYTSLLGLAQPQTGELSGTWGDAVNLYITDYVDAAVAGVQTISGSQTAVTLSVTNGASLVSAGVGATGSAQFQIINCTGNPASLLTITAPASSRQYIIINATSTSQSVKIVGVGPTTGITITSGEKAHVAWNGADFVKIATQNGTGEFVTVDTTNLEVTNIKAKDGTAAATIADSTGAITVSTILNVDNLRLDTNTLSSTDTNGNIIIAPNGTGDVQLDADTVRVGDSNVNVTITSNGTADLILNTNAGTNSGSITIEDGANGNIIIAPNGNGQVQISNAALDLTTIEVTNIKAKDGTASMVLTDSTGAVGISTAVTMSAIAQNIALGTSQTSGTFTVGGAAQTGTQTFDQSTKAHTLNIGAGATESAATKTINIGTGGVATSTTAIAIGSTNGSTTTLNGTVNLNAGTANGVAFLNASNVLTTGSALTFDGTNLSSTGGATFQGGPTGYGGGEVRLGTAASGQTSAISTLAVDSPVLFFDHRGSGNTGVFAWRNGTGSSNELMRLTSTGLGIGTSSPSRRLDVRETENTTVSNTSFWNVAYGGIRVDNLSNTTNTVAGIGFYGGTAANSISGIGNILESTSLGALGFFTGGSGRSNTVPERMRLDSSGNLGLGVTPSAWGGAKSFESGLVGNYFIGSTAASYTSIGTAAYYNGTNWIYARSTGASKYELLNNTHAWYNAPSGTAGNAISFTQAMTLDASGNLLVGTTSATYNASGRGVIELNGSSDNIFAMKVADAQNFYVQSNATNTAVWNVANTYMSFGTNNTERARISSDGTFRVKGAGLTAGSDDAFQVAGAAPANAARIDSSGNLLVGPTTNNTNSKLILGGATNWGVGTQAGGNLFYIVRDSDNVGQYMVNGSTSWTSTSDERVKDIIEPITDAANKVSTLRAVIGKFKKDAEGTRRSFLIAQDVQAVLPEAVTIQEDECGTLGVQYTEVIPLLVAAIQELKAEFDAYKATHP